MTRSECLKALGLSDGASEADIRKAYRSLANKYHPDKEGGDADQFAKINEANRRLKKNDFTHGHSSGPSGGRSYYYNTNAGHGKKSAEDIFEEMRRHGFDSSFFDDILNRTYSSQRRTVTSYRMTLDQVYSGGEFKTETGTLTVPRGVHTDSIYNMSGQNNHVKFTLTKHPVFERKSHESADLNIYVDISTLAMHVGTTIKVKHLSGDTLEIEIPAGTGMRSTLRVKGQGLPIFDEKNPYKKSSSFGDLYVILRPYTSKLSRKQTKELKEILGDAELASVSTP